MSKETLNAQDYSFILSALNDKFNFCASKLENKDKLGDIEKTILEFDKELVYNLICKIETITDSL